MYVLCFDDFGKNFPKSAKLSPDGFIQAAIQLTYYKFVQYTYPFLPCLNSTLLSLFPSLSLSLPSSLSPSLSFCLSSFLSLSQIVWYNYCSV